MRLHLSYENLHVSDHSRGGYADLICYFENLLSRSTSDISTVGDPFLSAENNPISINHSNDCSAGDEGGISQFLIFDLDDRADY